MLCHKAYTDWYYVSADFRLVGSGKERCISSNNAYSLMVQENNVSFVVSENTSIRNSLNRLTIVKQSFFLKLDLPIILYRNTGGPSSLQEPGRDSYLLAVLCYKRLFTKAYIGCKRGFFKERNNVMFLKKIDLPYCLVVFFVVCPRLRALFWCSTAKGKRRQNSDFRSVRLSRRIIQLENYPRPQFLQNFKAEMLQFHVVHSLDSQFLPQIVYWRCFYLLLDRLPNFELLFQTAVQELRIA